MAIADCRIMDFDTLHMANPDTIVAPATGRGQAAVAIIRISGPLCRDLMASTLSGQPPPPPRCMTLSPYTDSNGCTLDHLLYAHFAAPHSYTGDDVLELYPHGNPFIVRRIIDDLCARGCRMAEPGEFTRVAFMNGKMDLSQAEAVAEVIRVQSDAALSVAQRQLGGALARKVSALSDEILSLLANLEAYIDFPDEDLPPESVAGPLQSIATLRQIMDEMAATGEFRERLIDGWTVAILGAPNAGKSSLMNLLLGEARALVSAEAGTTRDYIRETVAMGPYGVHLVDTAGLRAESGPIEQMGMQFSMELAATADLVLWVMDSNDSPPPLATDLAELLTPSRTIVIANKADLPRNPAVDSFLPACQHVSVSVASHSGIDVLRGTIAAWIEQSGASSPADGLLVSRRHAECLRNASASLEAAQQLLAASSPLELAATEVRAAIKGLETIVGQFDNEAVLDRLFATFCIGK